MRYRIVIIFVLAGISASAQHGKANISGKYKSQYNFGTLELRKDSTFILKQVEPATVFPISSQYYTSHGTWTMRDKKIVLNPDLTEKVPEVSLTEEYRKDQDSIQITISYIHSIYSDNTLLRKETVKFNHATFYINTRQPYYHIYHHFKSVESWGSRKTNRYFITPDSTVKLPLQKTERIGIFIDYGFDNFIELPVSNTEANYFEITIVQPVDIDRTPRNQTMTLKHWQREGITPFSK